VSLSMCVFLSVWVCLSVFACVSLCVFLSLSYCKCHLGILWNIYLFLYLASGSDEFLTLHRKVGRGWGESNKEKYIFFKHALDTHFLVSTIFYNLLFLWSFIYPPLPRNFLSHIRLEIITANAIWAFCETFWQLYILLCTFHSS